MRTGTVAKALALIGLVVLAGCQKAKAGPALSKQTKDDPASLANVPVPPENGPHLYVLRKGVKVVDKPNKAGTVVGELMPGSSVARAADPISKNDCPGGFYPVRPKGFVCFDDKTSLNPLAGAKEPALDHALPYRYGRTTMAVPVYTRIPSAAEQSSNEPGLEKYLSKSVEKFEAEEIHTGALDVPVDAQLVPQGAPVMTKTSEGLGADGKRTRASFFAYNDEPAPVVATDGGNVVSSTLRKGSAVAISATFMTAAPSGQRRFGVTPDGLFVPVDKLDPIVGTAFHGVDLSKDLKLPIGFVSHRETNVFKIVANKAVKIEDEDIEYRSVVGLTNKFREIEKVRYEETEDGTYYRAKDLAKIVKKSKFPDFVKGDVKWVDVSLAYQTLTLYEGKKAVFATLVSSGEGASGGDPTTGPSSLQGTFKLGQKSLFAAVDAKESKESFDIADAPFSLEYSPGFTLRGAYWTDAEGEARSYHAINLSPVDARRVFAWVGGESPSGWSSVVSAGEDVTVVVRK